MVSKVETIVCPARTVRGSVRLPGDKSISHRYAMLAAIANGSSRLENYSTGADCASTLRCLQSLGVFAAHTDGAEGVIEIPPPGPSLAPPSTPPACATPASPTPTL